MYASEVTISELEGVTSIEQSSLSVIDPCTGAHSLSNSRSIANGERSAFLPICHRRSGSQRRQRGQRRSNDLVRRESAHAGGRAVHASLRVRVLRHRDRRRRQLCHRALWRNALSPYSKGHRRVSAVVLAVASAPTRDGAAWKTTRRCAGTLRRCPIFSRRS